MSIQLDRVKPTSWFLRIMYKLAMFLPMTDPEWQGIGNK